MKKLVIGFILVFLVSCKKASLKFSEIRTWSVEDSRYQKQFEEIDTIRNIDTLLFGNWKIPKRKFDSIVINHPNASSNFRFQKFTVQKLSSKIVKFDNRNIEVLKCYIFRDSSNYDFGILLYYSSEFGILIKQSLIERKIYKLHELKIFNDKLSSRHDTRDLIELLLNDTILTPIPPQPLYKIRESLSIGD